MRKVIAALVALVFTSCSIAHAEWAWKPVGSYVHGKYEFTVNQIPDWQSSIYKKLGISLDTQLLMRTLNQLECRDIDGFCFGLNAADAGPFQINQIHGMHYRIPEKYWYHPKDDYGKSRYLVKAGQSARKKALEDGNWSEVIRIRDELFSFQAKWTFERMKRLAKQYEEKVWYSTLPREKQVWYQAVWHNGNTKMQGWKQFRFWYGDKAVKHWRILAHAVSPKQYAVASQQIKAETRATVNEPIIEPIEDQEVDIVLHLDQPVPYSSEDWDFSISINP